MRFLGSAGIVALAASALLVPDAIEPRTILVTSSTILGQAIAYPSGVPLLTSGTLTLGPGEASDWHSHPVPLFASRPSPS
ncbi:MAG: hypothetical protein OEM24_06175 [Paracoccaceae bacterium]|nr:hypothetical protein [Paracoccaceae bacterium]